MTSPDPARTESSSSSCPTLLAGLSPALRSALVSAFGLFAFTLAFTSLMAFTHGVTRDRIRTAAEQKQMLLIDETLPGLHYDNALLADVIEVEGSGRSRVGKVWRARNGNAPVALVFETYAPDGYGGRIDLVASLDNEGRIGSVRVAAHQETPGLGDYIDPAKDRNKEKPWISQFSKADAASTRWEVKKDGGSFDYLTGATVSARAVTRAVGRAAAWVNKHREALFAAPTGARFNAEQKE
ncbi:MAG: RnfABCDGE type electron transport complex subunit G [Azoarcus sp.]|jgi:electron transport complex protein RnfG|nr:RnfABCDGE type electron transport complex subunit G [Azoarcus sp.]